MTPTAPAPVGTWTAWRVGATDYNASVIGTIMPTTKGLEDGRRQEPGGGLEQRHLPQLWSGAALIGIGTAPLDASYLSREDNSSPVSLSIPSSRLLGPSRPANPTRFRLPQRQS